MAQKQTGVATLRLQVPATGLPTGVGDQPGIKLRVGLLPTEAEVFRGTVLLLVLCSTFRTVITS